MGAWGIKALERDEGLDVLDILKNEYVPEHPVKMCIRDSCRIDPDIVRFLNLPYGTMQMRSEDGAWYEVIRDDEGEEET